MKNLTLIACICAALIGFGGLNYCWADSQSMSDLYEKAGSPTEDKMVETVDAEIGQEMAEAQRDEREIEQAMEGNSVSQRQADKITDSY